MTRRADALRESALRTPAPDRIGAFSADAHLGIAGPFDVFSLRPPGQLTVAVVDDFTQSTFIENEAEVATFERIFTYFRRLALDGASSQRLIQEIASGL
ncbi:Scr1 family TA system antitoxin-like transcriptional regulator [Actinoallomurus acanthiterrae]